MHRITRHIILFLLSGVIIAAFFLVLAPTSLVWGLSMATAYGSLGLLALTLVIGPWNKLNALPNPVSTYLRRDIGIWAGVLGITHVIAGLFVHMGGKFWLYFLPPGVATFPWPSLGVVQWLPFGLTNYLGLGATLILVLLLSLSNNASLRALGAARWKSLQRWNYFCAILTIAHGVGYQFLEKRTVAFIVAFAAIVVFALGMQFAGYRTVKKKLQ